MGVYCVGSMSKTYFEDAPTCDECDCEISGPVIKKGAMRMCRYCANGQPHPAVKAPITPVIAPPVMVVALPMPPGPKPKLIHLQIDLTRPACAVIGCPNPAKARRLCGAHWIAAKKTGQLADLPKRNWAAAPENIDITKPGCVAIGCHCARVYRGFCRSHYNNIRRNKLQYLLLPLDPNRYKKPRPRTKPPKYQTPMPIMREIVRLRKLGHTWHQAAILSGAERPTMASNRAKNLYLCGKINIP